MPLKYREKAEKLSRLDEKDTRILNILAENARAKLTKISKDVSLSVDSTKKRIQKLEKDGVIDKYTIQVNMHKTGLPLGVHVYLKLKDLNEEKYNSMISSLKKNPRVVDLMAMLGDYDLYIVFLAKDTAEIEKMKLEFREKFGSIIGEWKEVIVSKIYKLEEYKF